MGVARWGLVPVAAIAGVAWIAPGELSAQPSERNIAAGRRLYHQKADCQSCHGWSGDGVKMDNQAPDGANLRESALDREQLVFVIKCGLPGREMPAFDRLAYTDDRCLGRTRRGPPAHGAAAARTGGDHCRTATVERLVDFLLAKVVGQGEMNRERCIDFWGEEVSVCDTLP